MAVTLRPVESDAGYEAWRQVRMTVQPGERCDSAEELRRAATPPGLWGECFERFGRQALADVATRAPLQVSREDWAARWASDPMFLAVHDGEVIGCAGLDRDPGQPTQAEHGLTAVRRDWRRRGIATCLKRHTLRWAAVHGLAEVSTWTQPGNDAMRRLNESLGYTYGRQTITVTRPLPL